MKHNSDNCVDCDVNTLDINEYYMVTDSCWKRAGMLTGYSGVLCIGCLELRLGKKLTPRNFSECPLNWRIALGANHASDRLIERFFAGGKNSKWRTGVLRAINAYSKGDKTLIESMTKLSIGHGGR